jgi:hypothetical protein
MNKPCNGVWLDDRFKPNDLDAYLRETHKLLMFISSLAAVYRQSGNDPINTARLLNIQEAIPDPKEWITSLSRLMNIGPESKLKEQHYRDYLWMIALLKHTAENGDLLWYNRCRLNDISDASGWLIADTVNKINRYSKD